ncbi:MAG: hypothetical protein AB8B69_17565 [Chitinophagales bacterium]
MKAITIITLWAAIILQSPSFAQTETPMQTKAATSLARVGHLITLTADYEADAISIFYPDRTELIYVKTRKSRWVDGNRYCSVAYDVVYQDGTRKHFEDIKLFRKEDVMQRVVTDHISKVTELGYKLMDTEMTHFAEKKYLTAFFRFEG